MLFEPEIKKWWKMFIFVAGKLFLAHMLEAWKYKYTVCEFSSSFSEQTRKFGDKKAAHDLKITATEKYTGE